MNPATFRLPLVREVLRRRNKELLRDVEGLILLVMGAAPLIELAPYRLRVVRTCERTRAKIKQSLEFLEMGEGHFLEEVLSNTQLTVLDLRILNSLLANPILRALPSDSLCLKILSWLHGAHPETAGYPAAFVDGSYAMLPLIETTPLYYLPCAEQRGLLYISLVFHEFGHLLYALHEREMADLVADLQDKMDALLMPPSQRDDRYSEYQARQRQRLIDAWYSWTQELFCDAVGFTIGGPSFMHAFSSYLTSLKISDFQQSLGAERLSPHPATWLRVHMLCRRAETAGFGDLAQRVEREWQAVSYALGATEAFQQLSTEGLLDMVEHTISDMLIETAPKQCTESEANGGGWHADVDSPVRLLNWAWQQQEDKAAHYPVWEAEQIASLLTLSSWDKPPAGTARS